MKKTLLILIAILLIAPSAMAAQFYSDYQNEMNQNESRELFPFNIKAEADDEITAGKGLNLLLVLDKQILWDKTDVLVASGTAVEKGRIDAEITPQYLDDYKVLFIPVKSDWLKGETAVISGLRLRAYNHSVPTNYMGLDITGDKVADTTDSNIYRVTDTVKSDRTPPYPVENLTAVVNDAKTQVKLTWKNPPDYDLQKSVVDRSITRNGSTVPFVEISPGILTTEFTDTNVQLGDLITYRVYARDVADAGEMTEVTVDLKETVTPPEEVPVVEEPTPETNPEPQITKVEKDDLNRLYFYYKVRRAIKCLNEGGSECLWAKINLLYAQEITGKADVDLSLSERDLYLMGVRIRWPEQRYQIKCIDAETPDKTCSALNKSINRVHYFLDK